MKAESTKEEEQLANDLIHQVAASQSYLDAVVNMGMGVLEEANKELAQAYDYEVLENISHDVLSNYINQRVPCYKSHVNDVTDEEIFILD